MDLSVNGQRRTVPTDPERALLGVLRDELGLTGTKYGCGEGQCGACTVLIDGQPRRTCVTRLATVRAAEIRTIEGIAEGDVLHPVQQAFLDEGAMQCGFCIPGMVCGAVALLREKPDPSDRDIVAALHGNVCRCGTYPRILRAVRRAAAALRGGRR